MPRYIALPAGIILATFTGWGLYDNEPVKQASFFLGVLVIAVAFMVYLLYKEGLARQKNRECDRVIFELSNMVNRMASSDRLTRDSLHEVAKMNIFIWSLLEKGEAEDARIASKNVIAECNRRIDASKAHSDELNGEFHELYKEALQLRRGL